MDLDFSLWNYTLRTSKCHSLTALDGILSNTKGFPIKTFGNDGFLLVIQKLQLVILK